MNKTLLTAVTEKINKRLELPMSLGIRVIRTVDQNGFSSWESEGVRVSTLSFKGRLCVEIWVGRTLNDAKIVHEDSVDKIAVQIREVVLVNSGSVALVHIAKRIENIIDRIFGAGSTEEAYQVSPDTKKLEWKIGQTSLSLNLHQVTGKIGVYVKYPAKYNSPKTRHFSGADLEELPQWLDELTTIKHTS